MKKIAFFFAVLLSFFSLSAKDAELEALLKQAATEICGDIEGNVESLAVIDFDSQWWAVCDYIVDELSYHFSRKFGSGNVIAHDEFTRNLIAEENAYQDSGMVSDETIAAIGDELGVDCIVAGSVKEVSSGYQLIPNATQVETKKILSSWKGKIRKRDKEMKFQIEKSKNPRPVSVSANAPSFKSKKNETGFALTAEMLNDEGESVSVLQPGDKIRFKVSSEKSVYLAILCTDAHKDETWLPLQSNYLRAGESRIFPDIPGAVLRVEDGIFGNESVKVFAATVESDLPNQTKMMGTRAFKLGNENAQTAEAVIEYRVVK